MLHRMQALIDEYKMSIIQSEAEVRSKLIVPLLDILGYPSYLRAEEFPVYGHEGRKALPAKNADYILFSDREFAFHRGNSKPHIEWIQKHSLLIVEAKKPGGMPEILGQPQYYTTWTRAVAYLITDGINIKGYYYNNINTDFQVIDCSVADLPLHDEICVLSYSNILQIKQEGGLSADTLSTIQSSYIDIVDNEPDTASPRLVDANTIKYVTENDVKDFPEHSLSYMRYALGRNSIGLSNLQLITRFINTTDSYLQNEMRYDIPEYMFDFPRNTYKSRLYINNIVLPIEIGEVSEFYWDDYERFYYESRYLRIDVLFCKDELQQFELGFQVLDDRVASRLDAFKKVDKLLLAETLRISLDDNDHREFTLPTANPKKMWTSKEHVLHMSSFWQSGLEQMKAIEEFYEIEFKLHRVEGEENLNELYDAISFVYDGIVLNENCQISLPATIFDEDINIIEPIILEEKDQLPLCPRYIHDVCFVPYQSWLIPGTIPFQKTQTDGIVKIPGCCRYKIVDAVG